MLVYDLFNDPYSPFMADKDNEEKPSSCAATSYRSQFIFAVPKCLFLPNRTDSHSVPFGFSH